MTVDERATSAYSVATREQALNFMADYPGYGEQRWYSDALATEQVSFSWRRMPPATGGRGSYGHRHPGQEEVYFVISGTVTFKIDDDVFQAGPQTAIRIAGDSYRSVHNDTGEEAELLIFSARLAAPPLEKVDGFWP
jgi:mannose-6-phosphate isomerase-like protein (cupin superfamily)